MPINRKIGMNLYYIHTIEYYISIKRTTDINNNDETQKYYK